jgi:hypothetical protein
MIVLGLLFLAFGFYFRQVADSLEAPDVGVNLVEAREPIPAERCVVIKEWLVRNHPDGAKEHYIITILLENRFSHVITILGGESGCNPAGCVSIVLDGPKPIGSGESQWLEIDAKWSGDIDKPLSARFFTDRPLAAAVDMELTRVRGGERAVAVHASKSAAIR